VTISTRRSTPLLGAALALAACNSIFGVEVSAPLGEGGSGGTASTTNGSSSGGAGAGGDTNDGGGGNGASTGTGGGGGVACGGSGGTSGSAASCAALYGSAPDFELCEATSGTCRFLHDSTIASCAAICASGGGACILAADNVLGQCVADTSKATECSSTLHNETFCVCTRPCS
jgi:hypothetical protein